MGSIWLLAWALSISGVAGEVAEAATTVERQAFLASIAGTWPTLEGEPGISMKITEDGILLDSWAKSNGMSGSLEAFGKVVIDGGTFWQLKRTINGVEDGQSYSQVPVFSLGGLKDGNLYESVPNADEAAGWAGTPTQYGSGRTTNMARAREEFLKSITGTWPTLQGEPGISMTIIEAGPMDTWTKTDGTSGTAEAFDKVTIAGATFWQIKRTVNNVGMLMVMFSISGLKDGNLYASTPSTVQAEGWAGTPTPYGSGRVPHMAADRQVFLKSIAGTWPTLAGEPGISMTIKEVGPIVTWAKTDGTSGTVEAFDEIAVDGARFWQTKRTVNNVGMFGIMFAISGLKDGKLYESTPNSNQAQGWAGKPAQYGSRHTPKVYEQQAFLKIIM